MSYDEITIACENIIIDKVVTVLTTRDRQIDTRVPMEIGMAAKDDGTKEEAKENEVLERVRVGMKRDTKVAKVAEMHIREWWIHGRRAVARKEPKDKRREAREHVGRVVKQETLQRGVERAATTDESKNVEEKLDNDEELQVWCLLEEGENEQWQKAISR